MMFFLGFIYLIVSIQNLDNIDSCDANFFSFSFLLPPSSTMHGDMIPNTGTVDQMEMLPNVTLSSTIKLTTVPSQTKVTDVTMVTDDGFQHCPMDDNMTSYNKFVDWMVMEPNVNVSSAVEPLTVDLLSQINITYGADEDLQCEKAVNMTSYPGVLDGMSMETTDKVPTTLPLEAQTLIIIGSAVKDLELFSLPDLFDTVYFAVMLLMVSVYFYHRMKLSSLHRDLKKVLKNGIAILDLMADIEKCLDDQQSYSTKITFKNAKLNRKIGSVSADLDEEESDIEKLYEYLNDWKQEWIEQSHKIRQINYDYLNQQAELSTSQIDKFIEEQEKQMRDAAHYFGERFHEINQTLEDRHQAIIAMLREIDAIHDYLNKQSASQF